MPRDGSNIYHRPPGTDAVPDTTIESTKYNANVADVEQDLNTPRPVVAGGTGASDATTALANLNGEMEGQVVTNWDSMVFIAGSFYAASTATGIAPVAGHAFSGICYVTDANNMFIEARDQDDSVRPGRIYTRQKKAGIWSAWGQDISNVGVTGAAGTWVFNNALTFPPASGQLRFNNATQSSATHVFVSHITGTSSDVTSLLPTLIQPGGKLYLQEVGVSADYISFNITSVVFTAGDADITVTVSDAGSPIANTANTSLTALSPAGASMFIRYDTAQALTSAQRSQARANIDVTRKNYIINGAMMVSQENGATAGTTNQYYAVDQFKLGIVGTSGTVSAQQVASATPGGSPNRYRATVTAADAAVAAGDLVEIELSLEGLRIADLRFGSAAAKTVTIQFGVKAPAGTYCVTIQNGGGTTRSYVAEYIIAAGEANTDVIKSVTIPGDTTASTWNTDNTIGFTVRWGLMVGTTFQQAANSYGNTNAFGTANQYNFMQTSTPPNNVFELFDVSLTEGTVAPPFQVPDYASELALCKRYYQQPVAGGELFAGQYAYSTTASVGVFTFPYTMRAAPTISLSAVSDFACYGNGAVSIALTTFTFTTTTAGSTRFDTAIASGFAVNQASILFGGSSNAKLKLNARL